MLKNILHYGFKARVVQESGLIENKALGLT